ncbi:MAG TPA: hypothetical protein VIJ02_01085 [Thermoanaerobaculia bacterium]
MRRQTLVAIAILTSLATASTAGGQTGSGAPSETAPVLEQCQAGFSREGSFLKGTTYRTHAEIVGARPEPVLDQAAESLKANGLQVIGTDRAHGLITAVEPAEDDGGRDTPLSVAVKPLAGGRVRVELTLSLGAARKVPDEWVREKLCKIVSGVAPVGREAVPTPPPAPRKVDAAPPAAGPAAAPPPPAPITKEAAAPKTEETSAGGQCRSSFVKEGSFLKGTTYRGAADFRGLSREAALDRTAKSLAADGWQVTATDEKAGTITAVQQPQDGGRPFTLDATLKPRDTDTVRVEIRFSMGAMIKVPDASVRDRVCGVLSRIAPK